MAGRGPGGGRLPSPGPRPGFPAPGVRLPMPAASSISGRCSGGGWLPPPGSRLGFPGFGCPASDSGPWVPSRAGAREVGGLPSSGFRPGFFGSTCPGSDSGPELHAPRVRLPTRAASSVSGRCPGGGAAAPSRLPARVSRLRVSGFRRGPRAPSQAAAREAGGCPLPASCPGFPAPRVRLSHPDPSSISGRRLSFWAPPPGFRGPSPGFWIPGSGSGRRARAQGPEPRAFGSSVSPAGPRRPPARVRRGWSTAGSTRGPGALPRGSGSRT
jgi:hypothetical protein